MQNNDNDHSGRNYSLPHYSSTIFYTPPPPPRPLRPPPPATLTTARRATPATPATTTTTDERKGMIGRARGPLCLLHQCSLHRPASTQLLHRLTYDDFSPARRGIRSYPFVRLLPYGTLVPTDKSACGLSDNAVARAACGCLQCFVCSCATTKSEGRCCGKLAIQTEWLAWAVVSRRTRGRGRSHCSARVADPQGR
jgi:hypothetical protein